jgi:type II secretory pathway component PulF
MMRISAVFRVDPAQGRDFIRTLATAVESDIPLPRALRCLCKRGWSDRFSQRGRRVIQALEAGHPLSWAIDRHLSAWLPTHWPNAIAEAEDEGHLLETLVILAGKSTLTTDTRLRTVVRQLVSYMMVTFTIISGLCIFILPKFAKIFDEMASGAPLPDSIVFMFNIASPIFHSPLTPIVAFFLPILSYRMIGNRYPDLMARLPIIGRAARLQAAQEAAQSIAIALRMPIDITDALEYSASTCRFKCCQQQLLQCAARVRGGETWTTAWKSTALFDPFGNWILSLNLQTPRHGFETVAAWSKDQLLRYRQRRLRCVKISASLVCGAFVLLATASIFETLVMLIHHSCEL